MTITYFHTPYLILSHVPFLYLISYFSSVISVKKVNTVTSDYLGQKLLAHEQDIPGDYLLWSNVQLLPFGSVNKREC